MKVDNKSKRLGTSPEGSTSPIKSQEVSQNRYPLRNRGPSRRKPVRRLAVDDIEVLKETSRPIHLVIRTTDSISEMLSKIHSAPSSR